MPPECIRVFVSGRVQGVGFREWTRKQAQSLGVRGWVRNLADGRVEALLVAESEALSKLLELMRRGPTLSRVDDLHTKIETAAEEFVHFEVRR